ncbi:hypothetical protein DASB73_032750 [Starmerella bacillaris]|uniref:Uncharacterized protein n=1 Tax=Starmerella bacillaris TaxID=1247836 RepID=A0AAV5RMU7_STABA|nr:hypothetical protein DASB73_032750 [Starmerella bacillaris]
MTFTVNSYAAFSKDTDLVPHKLERRDLAKDDVLIDITYTGICHSDVHEAHNDWGTANYPIIPGHEIVGVVSAIGDSVTKVKVGDCVAVGCLVDSCLKCGPCLADEEIFCVKVSTKTYNSPEPHFPGHLTAGGYSEKIVVRDHFVLQVPKELQAPELLPGVAPLLCAGITMHTPLTEHHASKGQKVGIVGLGGLGSMGVKLAVAIGAEVVVISRNHKKDSKAKELGASGVLASTSKEELEKHAGTFDLIIDTVPFDHDVNVYIPLLKNHKTLVVVGHVGPFVASPISSTGLIFGDRRIAGSCIGGIKGTQEVLDFCAKHKIISDHIVINMEEVNDAWKVIGDTASRYVIDIAKYRESNKKA